MNIIVGVLVSTAINGLIGLLFPQEKRLNGMNLEDFLKIASHEFCERVETVVRAALKELQLSDIRSKTGAACEHFARYIRTGENQYLANAEERIIDASAISQEAIKSLLTKQTFPDQPDKKAEQVTFYLNALKASIIALKAFASLELVILSFRAVASPELRTTIQQKIHTYKGLADQLADAYLQSQKERYALTIGFEEKEILRGSNALYCAGYEFTAWRTIHLDGIQKLTIRGSEYIEAVGGRPKHTDLLQKAADALQQRVNQETQRYCVTDETQDFYYQAHSFIYLEDNNILEAKRTWEALNDAYN